MRKILIILVLMVAIAEGAHALSISPLPNVNIQKNEKVANLTIGDDTGAYQAYVYKVEQSDDGTETLIKTDDLVAYPIVFKAPRTLKIAVNKTINNEIEGYYRIIVRQLPRDKIHGLKTVLAFSIPVFVAAEKENADTKVDCGEGIAKIKNNGNVHAKFIVDKKNPLYVMPGKTISVKIKTLKDEDGKIICSGGGSI